MLRSLEHLKLSKWGQFEFAANQAMANAIQECPVGETKMHEVLHEVMSALRSQPVCSLDMPFEEYKDLRQSSTGCK